MKTSELQGAALDWAVAKCEGYKFIHGTPAWTNKYRARGPAQVMVSNSPHSLYAFAPTTDWSQGGPIIEREGICVSPSAAGLSSWVADMPLKPRSFADKTRCSGTPLIAAMRCYVASKLGDTIDIPEELQ